METRFINSIHINMYVLILMFIGLSDKPHACKNITKSKTGGSQACVELKSVWKQGMCGA